MAGTEVRLITAVQTGGEPGALADLFARHQSRLYNMSCALLRDKHEAEDVLQEVFLRVMDSLPRLKEPAAFPAWVNRITVTQALARRRSLQARTQRERTIAMERSETADAASDAEPLTHLRREVDALSDEDRDPVVLRYFHQLSFEEIGAAVGCAASTAKYRVDQALQRLRTRLAGSLGAFAAFDLDALLPKAQTVHPVPVSLVEFVHRTALNRPPAPAPKPAAPTMKSIPLSVIVGAIAAGLLVLVSALFLLKDRRETGSPAHGHTSQGPVDRKSDETASSPPVPGAEATAATEPERAVDSVPAPTRTIIRGRVMDDTGRPLPGMMVAVMSGVAAKRAAEESAQVTSLKQMGSGDDLTQISVYFSAEAIKKRLTDGITAEQLAVLGLHAMGITNAQGRFEHVLDKLQPGLDLRFGITSGRTPSQFRLVPCKSSGVQDFGDIVFSLHAIKLAGSIVDECGAPVADASVSTIIGWRNSEGALKRRQAGARLDTDYKSDMPPDGTDEKGQYAALFNVPSGGKIEWEFGVAILRKDGYAQTSVRIEAAEDGSGSFRATLVPEGRISGTVTDRAGLPVGGLVIEATLERTPEEIAEHADLSPRSEPNADRSPNFVASTDPDGRFVLVNLRQGRRYRLVPKDPRKECAFFEPRELVIGTTANDVRFLLSDLELDRGTLELDMLFWRVDPRQLRTEGVDELDVFLRLTPHDPALSPVEAILKIRDRRYTTTAERIEDGTYRAVISCRAQVVEIPSIQIRGGQVTTLKVPAPPESIKVSGIVHLPAECPVYDTMIDFTYIDTAGSEAAWLAFEFDAEGRFTSHPLTPGTYQAAITVKHRDAPLNMMVKSGPVTLSSANSATPLQVHLIADPQTVEGWRVEIR